MLSWMRMKNVCCVLQIVKLLKKTRALWLWDLTLPHHIAFGQWLFQKSEISCQTLAKLIKVRPYKDGPCAIVLLELFNL